MTGSAQVTGSVDILSGSLKVRGATALTGANIFEIKNTSADAFDDLFAFDDNGKITHEVDGAGDKHVIQTTSGATMFKFGVSAGSQGYLQIQNNGFTGAYLNNYGGAFGYGATVPSSGKSLYVLGDAEITGSLIVSGSGGLSVESSGSTVFEVIGSEGTLFSVDDDLDGIIFTANDRSGLPVLEASASGEVYIGKSPQSLYTTAVISSTTAATTQSIFGLSTSSYGGAFFDYTVQSGSNARAGSIMSVWNGSNISFTETTTTDIGDTTDFNVIVHISESQAQIASHASRAGYNIKTIIRSI
jgi:hypothetical protein